MYGTEEKTKTENERIILWVVYKNPSDYPNRFIARKWFLNIPTSEIILGNTLEEVRLAIPKDRVRLEPEKNDDPCIVEIWI